MTQTALITGASGGIGFELAKLHAKNGHQVILVARRLEKLEALKESITAESNVTVHVIPMDLGKQGAAQELYGAVKAKGMQVDYLINNAGFGDFGLFHLADQHKMDQMIEVNIMALTQLTRLFLPDMVKNKKGKILNVASTAAFQPGPTMAVYFATKAYVLHLTEAISDEIKNTGVTITALCPGATESGFMDAADMNQSKLFKNKKLPSSAEVAAFGYKHMMRGTAVAIHGTMNYIMANAGRFAPRKMVVKIARLMME